MKYWQKVLLIIVICILVGFYVWVLHDFTLEMYRQIRLAKSVTEALGFTYGTPYVGKREVFMITSVTLGGPMDRAGVKSNDIVREFMIGELFYHIEQSKRSSIQIPIEREGKNLDVTVHIPNF